MASPFESPCLIDEGETLKTVGLGRSLLLIGLFFFSCSTVWAAPADRAALYHRAKAATVLIAAVNAAQPGIALGSGVICDRSGLILTNAHVIAGASQVVLYTVDGHVYEGPSILAVDQDLDLAALRLPLPESSTAAMAITPVEALDGEQAVALGYPRLSDELRLGVALHTTALPVTISGTVWGRSRVAHQPVPLVQAIGAVNAGSSGGPLVSLETGGIIGLVAQAVPYTELARGEQGDHIGSVTLRAGIGYAVPATTLAKWLQEHRIPFQSQPAAATDAAAHEHLVPLRQEPASVAHATGHLLTLMGRILGRDPLLLDLAIYHYRTALALTDDRLARLATLADLGFALVERGDWAGADRQLHNALALLTPSSGNDETQAPEQVNARHTISLLAARIEAEGFHSPASAPARSHTP